MTSEVKELFVWIWLPGNTEPVVAGKLYKDSGNCFFVYGKSYLARENAIAVYDRELPLETGEIPTVSGLELPGCIRDSSPEIQMIMPEITLLFGTEKNWNSHLHMTFAPRLEREMKRLKPC